MDLVDRPATHRMAPVLSLEAFRASRRVRPAAAARLLSVAGRGLTALVLGSVAVALLVGAGAIAATAARSARWMLVPLLIVAAAVAWPAAGRWLSPRPSSRDGARATPSRRAHRSETHTRHPAGRARGVVIDVGTFSRR